MRAVSMLDSKLRLASLLLACSASWAGICLPYAAKADERNPRFWHCAYFTKLVQCCASFNKVSVLGKGYKDRWGWWSLASLFKRGLLALARAV